MTKMDKAQKLPENNDTQKVKSLTDKQKRYYIPAVKKLRLVLIAFAILYTVGFLPIFGDINSLVLGFAFPALYIVSGYLVLRQSEDTEQRILRAIKRTAICFAIMFVAYSGLSLILYTKNTIELFTQASFWIDFLLLNIFLLPVGSTIWYVQALLYAYIIIYLLYKLKLLKFDIYIAALCLACTLISGELASVVGFNFLGHQYIPGNFLTRALPYILIGCFIDRKKEIVKSLSIKKCIRLIFVGLILSVAEYVILNLTGNKIYVGHLLGMGVMAVAVALLPFYSMEEMGLRSERLSMLTRFELAVPYFVCSPIFALYIKIFQHFDEFSVLNYVGIMTLFTSMVMLYVYFYIRLLIAPLMFKFRKKK